MGEVSKDLAIGDQLPLRVFGGQQEAYWQDVVVVNANC